MSALAAAAFAASGLTAPAASGAPAPGNVYVANRLSGDLSAFALLADGTPSVLRAPVPTGGNGPQGVAITPDGRHAYVTNTFSDDLSRFDIAPDGSLARAGAPAKTGSGGPLGVAITPDGRHAYVANDTADSVSRFDIAPDGTLTQSGAPVTTGGKGPRGVAITPDGRHVYVTDYRSHDVSRLDIAPDGALTQSGAPVLTGGLGPLGVAITPDGRHAYVSDYISRDVSRFDIASDGSLTHVGAPVNTGGVDPQGLAITPDGRHAYVVDNGSSDLSRFDIGPDGTLIHVGAPVATGGTGPEDVAITPDGHHAYVPDDDTGDLSHFDIAPDGALTRVGTPVATGGRNPGEIFSVAARPDQGPTAVLALTVAPVGEAWRFDASRSSDPDGRVVRYDWSFGDGTGRAGTGPAVGHAYTAAGTYRVSVTATDDAGCSTTQVFTGQTMGCNGGPAAQCTTTISVPAASDAGAPLPGATLPRARRTGRITHMGIKPPAFAADTQRLPAVAASHSRSRKAKAGALVSYTGTARAVTTFTIQRIVVAQRSAGGCVADIEPRRYTRYLSVGSFVHTTAPGSNHFRFTGRINHHRLRPGEYRLQSVPRNRAGTGPAVYRRFRVTR